MTTAERLVLLQLAAQVSGLEVPEQGESFTNLVLRTAGKLERYVAPAANTGNAGSAE